MSRDPISEVASWLPAEANDPLIALIRERARLHRLRQEVEARAAEIKTTLPRHVMEGKVSITFSAGFTEPGNFGPKAM